MEPKKEDVDFVTSILASIRSYRLSTGSNDEAMDCALIRLAIELTRLSALRCVTYRVCEAHIGNKSAMIIYHNPKQDKR